MPLTSTGAEARPGILEETVAEIHRKKINAVRLSFRHSLSNTGEATILYIPTQKEVAPVGSVTEKDREHFQDKGSDLARC